MRFVRSCRLAAMMLICLTAAAIAQGQPSAGGGLTIAGDVPKPLTLSSSDLKQLPRASVVRHENDKDVRYEGVLVSVLLERAGVLVGQGMGRPSVSSYVVAAAQDGYRAVFALAEIDPVFMPNQILVADTVDGKPLPDGQGPLRLVSPGDKASGRFVRMLQRIDLVRLK